MNTQKIENRLDKLTNQIYWLEKKIKDFPEGKIYCERDGHYIKWFIRNGKDNQKNIYPKSSADQLNNLSKSAIIKPD